MSFLEKPRFLAILVVTVAALELVMFLMKTYEGSPDLLVLAKGTQGELVRALDESESGEDVFKAAGDALRGLRVVRTPGPGKKAHAKGAAGGASRKPPVAAPARAASPPAPPIATPPPKAGRPSPHKTAQAPPPPPGVDPFEKAGSLLKNAF